MIAMDQMVSHPSSADSDSRTSPTMEFPHLETSFLSDSQVTVFSHWLLPRPALMTPLCSPFPNVQGWLCLQSSYLCTQSLSSAIPSTSGTQYAHNCYICVSRLKFFSWKIFNSTNNMAKHLHLDVPKTAKVWHDRTKLNFFFTRPYSFLLFTLSSSTCTLKLSPCLATPTFLSNPI